MGYRLKQKHIYEALACRLVRRGLGGKAVEAPEERGERLAAPSWCGHQHMASGGHLLPAPLLDRGRIGEGGAEPVADRWRKELENLPHSIKFDRFRRYKQVFLTAAYRTLAMQPCIRSRGSRRTLSSR